MKKRRNNIEENTEKDREWECGQKSIRMETHSKGGIIKTLKWEYG